MATRVLKKFKKLPIHPTFILLFLWFIFAKNLYSFLLFCSVILTHEFGHFYVAKKLGYKLDSFFIAPYGVCLNYKENFFEQQDEILIAFAGPIVNFILSIFVISLWWIFPEVYNYTQEFVFQSVMLGLFNLLPCYPLDGGRIFVSALSKSQPRKKAIRITMIFNIVVAAILFILFIVSIFIGINPSFCFCAIFMILGIIDFKQESKYVPMALYKKKTKNFSKPFFYIIDGSITIGQALKKIEPNRYTIFILVIENNTKTIDEQKVKLLSLKYSLDTTFSDIFN